MQKSTKRILLSILILDGKGIKRIRRSKRGDGCNVAEKVAKIMETGRLIGQKTRRS